MDYSNVRVKEFCFNSGSIDVEINKWLMINEDKYEIVDIKLSCCHFRPSQTKTVVLVIYRTKNESEE